MRTPLTASLLAVVALSLVGCAPQTTGSHEVVYSITSDATSTASTASITYVVVTGADISQAEADGESLPWSKTVAVADGAFSNGILRVAGQLGKTGASITCDISVDGESIASETSTGPSAAVTCKGTD